MIKELTDYLVESMLKEDHISKVVAIYAGRFQPPAAHHFKTFQWVQKKFGNDNSYIATSDKVELPDSPLNFDEKQKIWAKHGVDSSKVVKVKSPYDATEVVNLFDPNTTAVVYVFGKKDADRLQSGTKKDGQPTYFQPYKAGNVLDNYTKHGYFLVAPHVSLPINGKDLSGTSVRHLLGSAMSEQAKKALFTKIFGWYDDVLYKLIVPKFKTASKNLNDGTILKKKVTESLVEGGHLFGTDKIDQQFIKPTINAYVKELSRLFPKKQDALNKFGVLGSAGKKDSASGDIDLSYSDKDFYGGDPNWGFSDDEIIPILEKFKKAGVNYKKAIKSDNQKEILHELEKLRRRTVNFLISKTINEKSDLISTKPEKADSESIMSSFVQHDESGQTVKYEDRVQSVQVDVFIGDQNWLAFANFADDYRRNTDDPELGKMYSDYDSLPVKGEVKGAHRTQLLLSLLSNKRLSFSHKHGITNMDTKERITSDPTQIVEILNRAYNFPTPITDKILNNYHRLHNFIKQYLSPEDYAAVIDSFLKYRLESQRLDIPSDLIDYWKANKDRLGLTGKFQDAQRDHLKESGSAGGDRVSRQELDSTVKDYFDKIIKPKYPTASFKVAGSYNTPSKGEFGDVDLILKLDGDSKQVVKKDLMSYLGHLSDDVILPFKSEKYKGKKFYNSGEIITVLYNVPNTEKVVQIDNIISVNDKELDFKHNFLKMPGEKQAMLLGLVKTVFLEESPQDVFLRMGLNLRDNLQSNQEYEFNLSSHALILRKVTYDSNLLAQGQYKEISREELWNTSEWSNVEKLLSKYNIEHSSFENLLSMSKGLKNPRSKNRVKGVFKSMLSVKSGEVNTDKGNSKLSHLDSVSKL